MCIELGKITLSCIFCNRTLWTPESRKLGYIPKCASDWKLEDFKEKKNIFGSYGIMTHPETIDDVLGLVDEKDIPSFIIDERQKRLENLISMCNGCDPIKIDEKNLDSTEKTKRRMKEEEKESNPKRIKK